MDENQYRIAFGKHIKRTREEKDITQSELAALMNINAQNISSYERGERCPSVYWTHRLCEALGVELPFFLSEFYQTQK